MTCGSLIQSGRKKDVPEGFRLWKQINEAQFTGGGEGVGGERVGWGVCVCLNL